jgi:hypothetical protein
MATISLRSATGAATKSFYIGTSTTEYVSVLQDAQGFYSLGNTSPVGLSDVSEVEYKGGGTGWQCDCDNSVILTDASGNLFWGGLPGTRIRR